MDAMNDDDEYDAEFLGRCCERAGLSPDEVLARIEASGDDGEFNDAYVLILCDLAGVTADELFEDAEVGLCITMSGKVKLAALAAGHCPPKVVH